MIWTGSHPSAIHHHKKLHLLHNTYFSSLKIRIISVLFNGTNTRGCGSRFLLLCSSWQSFCWSDVLIFYSKKKSYKLQCVLHQQCLCFCGEFVMVLVAVTKLHMVFFFYKIHIITTHITILKLSPSSWTQSSRELTLLDNACVVLAFISLLIGTRFIIFL